MTDDQNPYKAPETELKAESVPLAGGDYTETMAIYLKQTRPWVRFISVLGFIGVGFMVIASIVMIISGGSNLGFAYGLLMGVVYLAMAVLYLFPVLHLSRYASSISRFLESARTVDMEAALKDQKAFWKLSGILVIVGFGLGLLAVVVAAAIGINSAL